MGTNMDVDVEGSFKMPMVSPEGKSDNKRKTPKSLTKAFLMSHLCCDFVPWKEMEWTSLPSKYKMFPYKTIFGSKENEEDSSHKVVHKIEVILEIKLLKG